jgi:hypothetical protein
MDISDTRYLVKLAARSRLCEHCATPFFAGRSDQRFCTDRCRLRHWRNLRSTPSPCTETGQERLADISSKLDRLEAQLAELRQAHVALSEALTHCRCTISNQAPDLAEPSNDSDRS